ncbi:hypothetical protein NDU88_009843 [Pleurodeles waltl]|uniref:Uncharacterized protein n=1 Tax=Pleurodeles waltl TaxID=8319 RepID=A0AAV7QU64_PLEWA|nr:hypothetical protein NDU88_009843 [Pleurodeles waltl]
MNKREAQPGLDKHYLSKTRGNKEDPRLQGGHVSNQPPGRRRHTQARRAHPPRDKSRNVETDVTRIKGVVELFTKWTQGHLDDLDFSWVRPTS